MRQLRDENARLERRVTELTPDNRIPGEVVRKTQRPALHRAPAKWIGGDTRQAPRKAIEPGQISHGGWYARSQARDQSALRYAFERLRMPGRALATSAM
jgi:hypothetical protein